MTKVYNLYFNYLDTDLLAFYFLKGEIQVKLFSLKAVVFKKLFIFSNYPFVTAALWEAVDDVFCDVSFDSRLRRISCKRSLTRKLFKKNCIRFRESRLQLFWSPVVFFYTRTPSFKKVDRNFSFKRLIDNGSYINRKLFLENFEECTFMHIYLNIYLNALGLIIIGRKFGIPGTCTNHT